MIAEISFKCLIFSTVLPIDLFKNPVKYLSWSIFVKIVNNFYPVTVFRKKLHHRYLTGF